MCFGAKFYTKKIKSSSAEMYSETAVTNLYLYICPDKIMEHFIFECFFNIQGDKVDIKSIFNNISGVY